MSRYSPGFDLVFTNDRLRRVLVESFTAYQYLSITQKILLVEWALLEDYNRKGLKMSLL